MHIRAVVQNLMRNRFIVILSRLNWWLISGLLIIAVTHLLWIFGRGILTYQDWGYIYPKALKELLALPSIWDGKGLGQVNLTASTYSLNLLTGLFAHFGATNALTERIVYMWPSVIGGYLGAFFLVKYFTGSNKAAFVGGIIYRFNVAVLLQQTAHLNLMGADAFAPFALLYFIRAFRYRKLADIIIGGIFGLIVSSYDFRVFYIVALIAVFYTGVELLCGTYSFKEWFSNAAAVAASLFVTIILSSFWLIALGSGGQISSNSLFSRGLFGAQYLTTTNAIALYHSFWTSTGPQLWIISSPAIYFWILPALATYALIRSQDKKVVLFFAVIVVLGILLTKETDEPFTGLYQWLYNNLPGFNAFREASKFYFLIAVGYALLIATLFVNKPDEGERPWWRNNNLLFIPIGIFVLLNLLPQIKGDMGSLFVTRHIPNDYRIFSDNIEWKPGYFRTLWVPISSRWSEYSAQHPEISVSDLSQDYLKPASSRSANTSQSKIATMISSPNFRNLLNDASVRYVVVPIRDTANDDDFFGAYGDDRQFFINALNNVSYLKRINIGTKQLAVYENTSARPYITTANSVYGLYDKNEIPSQLPVLTSMLSQDFYIPKSASQKLTAASSLGSLFDTEVSDPNSGAELKQKEKVPSNSFLYIDKSANDLFYGIQKGVLRLYDQHIGGLTLNDKVIDSTRQSTTKVAQTSMKSGREYYIGNGSRLEKVNEKRTGWLEFGSVAGATTAYSASADNLITDPSFEQGLWQKKVQDCNDYDNEAAIGMRLSSDNATNGKHSLELQALNHTACTNKRAAVHAGSTYLFSFDYGNEGGQKAGYKLIFDDTKHTIIGQDLYVNGKNWESLLRSVTVPAGATHVTVQIFGYPDQNSQDNSLTYYDNFRLSQLQAQAMVPAAGSGYQKVALPAGQATFAYRDVNYPMTNILPNGSLEQGLWQKKVGDCNNYDNNPQISMKLDKTQASSGKNSLQLEASRHTACTGPAKPVHVSENATYLFSFDYQTPDNASVSYRISYNDPSGTSVAQSIPIKSAGWHHYVTSLQVPQGATNLSLLVYAVPNANNAQSIVRYDNFKLVQISDVLNHYYVVTQPKQTITPPRSVRWRAVNPTKKTIEIRGASTPFYLAMSETYDPKWRLELNNANVRGLLHNISSVAPVNAVPASDHIDLNDFENGWYVDPARLCADHAAGCTRNADGSYNLRLVAEFTPQRWFYIGSIVSAATLVGCIGYLGYVFWHNRRKPTKLRYKARR